VPSRRTVLTACSACLCFIAGCPVWDSSPDIPRETRILDARTTIEPGAYEAWYLPERIDGASLTPEDGYYQFSYEFVVEEGPGVMVATTTSDELERRRKTDGPYRVWVETRTEGKRGATSKQMPIDLLELLVVDTRSLDAGKQPDPDSTTVRIQAYLSSPDRGSRN